MSRHIPPVVALLTACGFALLASPAADALEPRIVRSTATLPLAVVEVQEIGVPAPTIRSVVVDLNEARVPAPAAVEVVRYSAFPVVLRTEELVGVEVDLPWDLADLDMSLLLRTHRDAGLSGRPLALAVFRDLRTIGFAIEDGRIPGIGPPPIRGPRFVYYLEPGYRFETDRGVFRGRPFVVPPGHAKHHLGGPHPTPGHVKHDRPGGPPGHAQAHPGGNRPDRKIVPPGQAKKRGPGARKPAGPPGKPKPGKPNAGKPNKPNKPDRSPR